MYLKNVYYSCSRWKMIEGRMKFNRRCENVGGLCDFIYFVDVSLVKIGVAFQFKYLSFHILAVWSYVYRCVTLIRRFKTVKLGWVELNVKFNFYLVNIQFFLGRSRIRDKIYYLLKTLVLSSLFLLLLMYSLSNMRCKFLCRGI